MILQLRQRNHAKQLTNIATVFFLIAFERMEHSSPRGSKNYTNHSLDVHLKMASNSSGIHLCGLD